MGEEPRGMLEMRKVREELRRQSDGPRSFLSPEERMTRMLLSAFERLLIASRDVCAELDKFLDSTDPFSPQYEQAEKVLTSTRVTLEMAQKTFNQIPDKIQGAGLKEGVTTQ